MNFDQFNSILSPILLILVGILIKVSPVAQRTSYKKFWWSFIVMGIFLLLKELFY
ncbi:hypothetical protein ACXZ1K_11410 [Pedobacter sp. PWIIR3]